MRMNHSIGKYLFSFKKPPVPKNSLKYKWPFPSELSLSFKLRSQAVVPFVYGTSKVIVGKYHPISILQLFYYNTFYFRYDE